MRPRRDERRGSARRPSAAAADASRGGALRPHGPMGRRRQRGLALPDDDAAEGRCAGVPLNPNGRRAADAWDSARDEAAGEQCSAYGVAAIMRLPTRVHISWAGRPDDEDRERRRHADANAPVRSAAHTRRRLAGRVGGQLGSSATVIAGGFFPAGGAAPARSRSSRRG